MELDNEGNILVHWEHGRKFVNLTGEQQEWLFENYDDFLPWEIQAAVYLLDSCGLPIMLEAGGSA